MEGRDHPVGGGYRGTPRETQRLTLVLQTQLSVRAPVHLRLARRPLPGTVRSLPGVMRAHRSLAPL